MANKKFAWKKDTYDKRDFMHVKAAVIPNIVILDKWMPDIRDQGDLGSCVGFGVGANLSSIAKKLDVYTEWFSPTWIYNGARYIEGSLSSDDGCEPRNAMKWIASKGNLLEQFWPYDPIKLDTHTPSSANAAEAIKRPIVTYFRVTGVDGICSAISQGYFVSIGTPWYDKWVDAVGPDGILAAVTNREAPAGGHETCLFGYDRTKQMFYGMNSWSAEWGKNGTYEMPFSSFAAFNFQGGYDAHCMTAAWTAVPVPVPVPVPTPASTPVVPKIRLQESMDNGASWVTLFTKNMHG